MIKDNILSESRVRYKIRRGMLELDLILRSFVDNHYSSLTTEQQVVFNQLLELEDPELYRYFFAAGESPTQELADMIDLIRNSIRSDKN